MPRCPQELAKILPQVSDELPLTLLGLCFEERAEHSDALLSPLLVQHTKVGFDRRACVHVAQEACPDVEVKLMFEI